MKKSVCLATVLIIIFSFIINSSAAASNIRIDGKLEEWNTSGAQHLNLLKNDETGNSFTDISVSYIMDESAQRVYFLFVASNRDSKSLNTDDAEKIKTEFTPAGGEKIIIIGNGESRETADTKCAHEAAQKIDLSSGTLFLEAVVNYKDGIPYDLGTFSVMDKDGVYSNTAHLSRDELTTENKTEKSTTAKETTAKETTRKTATTTTETTTWRSANKDKKTEIKTTKRVTTERTAVIVTEAEKTTQIKTTEKTTVKNSEKSETVKTVKTEATTEYKTEKSTSENSVKTTSAESAFGNTEISKSTLYKLITGICALVLFGVLGAFAVKSKQKDEEKEDPDAE